MEKALKRTYLGCVIGGFILALATSLSALTEGAIVKFLISWLIYSLLCIGIYYVFEFIYDLFFKPKSKKK